MSNILVRPPHLRQISEQLKSSANKIGVALQAIDNDILALRGDKFLGNRANSVQKHYGPKRDALLKAKNIILHFAADLQNTASVFEQADRSQSTNLPLSGGSVWGMTFLGFPSDNPFQIFLPWDSLKLPEWLRGKLDRIFRPAQIVTPLAKEQPVAEVQPETGFGKLLHQNPSSSATASAAISPDAAIKEVATVPVENKPVAIVESPASTTQAQGELSVSYGVPIKAQGAVYGNAGCTPTSISMVLDYYNTQNKANKTLSAQQIVDMSDAADRKSTKGMSLTNLTDELETLGYKNIDVKINAQYSDLQTAIKDGPVIVTAGVKLTGDGIINSSGSRALVGPGNITHAMVVSGVGDEQVLVNDPWSGTQVKLSKETFEKMWTRGSGGMYSIRP